MNIEEKIVFLRKNHPKFDRIVMWDTDNKGNEFAEIIYPNEKNPTMPIAVSVSDEGCIISVGKFPNVTGDYPISVQQASEAIEDVINDRIIFVFGYEDVTDEGGAPFMTEVYPLNDGDDNMCEELEKFIAKISTPVTGFKRKFARLKGRFVITNFSGSENKVIIR